MQFRVLGPLEVDAGDGPIPLGGPKQRAVLANLLIRANQVVPADALIADIWGDEPPEKARNTLQTYVSNLRRTLGDDRLQGRAPGYVLLLDTVELDAERFDSLMRDASKALTVDPTVAIATLDDALALWRGPALADLVDQPSLLAEAARLDELRLEAQERRVEGLLASGEASRAIGELEGLLVQHQLREGLWALLMLACYRDGRQAEALNTFQRAREILADELGIDPSPDLTRLQEQILRHDPDLDLTGEQLRGYRLLEEVGDGPDAVVFRAVQPHVERDVAIKIFRERVSADPAFVRRFDPDARIAAALEHPAVVPIHDSWREPGRAYIVSRYLRGGSLRALGDRGERLDVDRAARVVEQIATALAYAHRQGVIHGNVGAPNVLFDAEGNAYLGDFLIRGRPLEGSTSDIASLAQLTRDLLGPDMSARLHELVEHAEVGDDPPDADGFARAARAMLDLEPTRPMADADARNPFKGLRSFSEADARDFFGRSAVVERLVGELNRTGPASRFLALVGPSGSGKSSIVAAGLVPAMRSGALAGSTDPAIAEMFPGTHPLEELEAALMRIAMRPATRLRDTLESGSRGLLQAVDLVLPGTTEVVLVVDQFEEVFTLTASERDRTMFLEGLRVACMDPASRIRVVVTLRADFFDRPLASPRFGELLATRTEPVPPLTPDELEQAIRRPAERVGVSLERGLDAAMVADVAHQPGALPLLQYALTELFERRAGDRLTIDAYRRIGGIAGAVSSRAERLYRDADPGWRRAVRQVCLRLVTLGEGTRDTRRRVTRRELESLDVDPATLDDVLESLGHHRLLTFDREPTTREPTVEIAHEALLDGWSRLSKWIDDARDDLRHHARLTRAAAEWRGSSRDPSFLMRGTRLEQIEAWVATTDLAIGKQERDYLAASIQRRDLDRAEEGRRREQATRMERRSRTRLRALVAVFAIAAVVAGSLTLVATEQRDLAERQARIGRARELAAAANSGLEEDAERSVLLAAAAVAETRALDGSVLPEAEDALHRAIAASRVSMTAPDLGGAVAWGRGGMFAAVDPARVGRIAVGDTKTGDVVRTLDLHDDEVTGLAFSADGSLLASTGADGVLRVVDPTTAEERAVLRGDGEAWSPTFSRDGEIVAAAWPEERLVRIVDSATGRLLEKVEGPDGAVRSALAPDGRALAIEGAGRVSVFGSGSARVVIERDDEVGVGGALAWSPDGRYLAAGGLGGPTIWDSVRDLPLTLSGQPWIDALAWSPDSRSLVTGGSGSSRVKVWDIGDSTTGERLTLGSLETNDGVGGVAFSPDGSHVIAGASDLGAVKAWDLSDEGDIEVAHLATVGTFGDVAFLPEGEMLALGEDRRLRTHDLATGDASGPIARRYLDRWFDTRRWTEHAFDLSPDGSMVALPWGAGAWSTRTGGRVFSTPYTAELDGVTWSADGELLAIADLDRGLTAIVDRRGDLVAELPDQESSGTWQARFSPDGRLVATIGGEDPGGSLIVVWDLRRREVVRTMRTESAKGLIFDPSGDRLITMWGPPIVWDVRTGERLGPLDGAPSSVAEVEFSPDGRRIATTGGGDAIHVLDAETEALLYTLDPDDPWPLARLAFNADGSMLAAQSPNGLGGPGAVRVWALEIDMLLEIAAGEVTRPVAGRACAWLPLDGCRA